MTQLKDIVKPSIPAQLETLADLDLAFSTDTIDGALITDDFISTEQLIDSSINESSIVKTSLAYADVSKLDITDCEFKACDFTASKFPESSWLRVSIAATRCTGLQLFESTLRNITFVDSKLDLVNFRKTKLENVVFQNCTLTDVDFNGGNLKNVTFINCILHDVTFNDAKMVTVDISESTIEHIQGISSLRGVTISESQLMMLAPSLALAAGLKVRESDAR